MTPCTLAQAREFISAGYGECDPAKLTAAVNKIRQYWYSWYAEITLFVDAVQCFRVHRFDSTCNGCQDGFMGVTLPRDFQTVEAMWYNDYPVRLQSDWREFQTGISPECDCRLVKYDLPGYFPAALDICSHSPKRLVLRALDEKDAGLRMTIRGTSSVGQPVSEQVVLSSQGTPTENVFSALLRSGGIQKVVTTGRVMVLDEDSRFLSVLEPDETLPAYRRIKITGLPDSCQVVNIRAARKFFPLSADDDLVEIDNAVAFDAMGRYLRIFETASRTSAQIQDMTVSFNTAKGILMGDKSRDLGKGTEARLTVSMPRALGGFGRHLHRTGGRW